MEIHAALEEVARWCAQQTAAGAPDALEVDCHATVWITIYECAPPWHVRRARRCSAGATAPVAQLRYDLERRDWTLHHGLRPPQGWCDYDAAARSGEVGPLLDLIADDCTGRFEGLPPDFRWS